MSQDRQYECIIFGATGYTGKYTAEHVATSLPTDFKWAIAGRSESKLKAVAEEIQGLNRDRPAPGIEIAQLNKADLVKLAKKTKVLISTVGPYHKYGAAAVEACAETGTHYLDCTGEVPFVYDMIQKYGALAKKNGAIMIPQNGVESAPSDLLCWLLVTHIRQTLNVGTAEIIDTIYELKATASGGTLATVLTLFDSYSLLQLGKRMHPWSLAASTPPKQSGKPILEALTGVRTDSDLGILGDSIQGPSDIPIINRSWGLIDGGKFYGPNFKVSSYMSTSNWLKAFALHLAISFGFLAIVFPPVRWLLKKYVYAPGDGPSKEQVKHEFVEWRAIANADTADPNDPKRAFGRVRYEGSMYKLTGTTLAEAAITISRDKTLAHEIGGGILTPATLGAPYLERLKKAGLQIEVKTLP